jgi:oligopeptidase A
MPRTGQAVLDFIAEMHGRVHSQFHEENAILRKFISEKTGAAVAEILPWDRGYWSEKRKRELYEFDSEDLHEFFPTGHVLKGLFIITSAIYGIRVVEGSAEVYHPDVKFIEVFYAATDRHIASFFADLYPRDAKGGRLGGLP